MEIKQVTYTILTASEGYLLTNGVSYGETVALGVYDSPDNWYEITQEEYEQILAEEEKKLIEE